MLYIIGGPAKSGKTTLRKEILNRNKISGFSTDFLRTMLQKNPDLNINYKNTPEKNSKNSSIYLQGFIEELLNFTDEDFLIEGDMIDENLFKIYKKIKISYLSF